MNTLFAFIVVVQVLAALTIIGLVLVQHGKGADMGAAFGSGASGSLFGASGSSNFLSKSTGVAAAIFFGATLALAFVGSKGGAVGAGVMERLTVPADSAPAAGMSAPGGATGSPDGATSPVPAVPGNQGQAGQIPK